jgi:hypothetical protein
MLASRPEHLLRGGNALTLTVDAHTYQVTDFGITPNVPDLTQISSDVVNLAQ